jgi:hypothetical protein
MGITWNPVKRAEERWDFKEPLVIPPQILAPLTDFVSVRESKIAELQEQVAEEQRLAEEQQAAQDSVVDEEFLNQFL